MTFLTTKSNKSTLHCHGIAETRGTPGNWGGKAKFDFLQEISTNYPPRAKKDKKECALPWCLLWWTNSTCGHSLPKKRTNKTMHAVNILCRIISICVVTQLESIRRGPDSNICLSRQGLQLPLSTVPISRYESSSNTRIRTRNTDTEQYGFHILFIVMYGREKAFFRLWDKNEGERISWMWVTG